MKKKQLICIMLGCALMLSACSKASNNNNTTQAPTTNSNTTQATTANTTTSSNNESSTSTTTTEPTTDSNNEHAGMSRSPITGQWVSTELANRTPVAVMINNIKAAMPMYGITYADVILEAYAEGGITRFCAIFDDYEKIPKLGSLRSCREYFLYFAKEYEATYFHFGQASFAIDDLARSELRAINFITNPSLSFRTTDRKAPHNAFTTGELLATGVAKSKMSTSYPANYKAPFKFNTDDNKEIELSSDKACTYFAPGFAHNKPYFKYDEKTKTYLRYQFDGPHIDALTNTQLSCKNIVVKYVNGKRYENSSYLDYEITGTGKGLYITNGKVADITWEKNSDTVATTYKYADGSEIVLNQGKTFVIYVENNKVGSITIE